MAAMDSLEFLKNIQKLLNFLLRYIVAGGSAVLAFGLTQDQPFSFLRVGTELSALLLLFFVSVIGPALYAILAAVIHVIIVWIIFLPLRRKYKLNKGKCKLTLRAMDFDLASQ